MTDWEFDSRPAAETDPRTETMFAVGGGVVAVNTALYFFGVGSLSHPVVTILGAVLLAALYLDHR